MASITFTVEGMSCQHCVMNVQKALDGIKSVRSSTVSIGSVTVEVDDPAAHKESIARAIRDAGYRVVEQTT